ncbi:DUF2878 domain-containing protein [Pseudoalteromonas sp. NEC-BIFX-2020_015]|nr:DUF2878 domain-containing protein [Pseudoalteromonas sp. NEC-BIFX-2020_015]
MRSVINFALFQGVWFMALLLETRAIIPILCVIGLMVYLSKQKKQDLILITFGLVIALTYEYLMVLSGMLYFKQSPFPFWLVLLWCALLLTLNTSMQFLNKLPWFFSLLVCAISAPASYWAGARFGVITIAVPLLQFWLVYGVAWSCMFNLIMYLNKRFAQNSNQSSPKI